MAKSFGKLKHLVFSSHGHISFADGKITDSIINIKKLRLDKSNVGLFSELSAMSGGVIWAGACGIANDHETNKLRAKTSGCYFVAPVLYMTIKPGSRRPGPNMIDMYKRFYPQSSLRTEI